MQKQNKGKTPSDKEVFHQVLGMKKKPHRFDNVTIEQLEKGIGKAQISLAFLITTFFIAVITLAFSSDKINSLSTMASDVTQEPAQIIVTAEVPNLLGIKKIDEDEKEITFLVYGNNEKGFSFVSQEEPRVIFGYNKMPGDGVLVVVPRSFTYIVIGSYY